MHLSLLKCLPIAAVTLAWSGCAGSYKHTLSFNASEPFRIAVLPFAQVDEHGELIRADGSLLIDNVALVSSHLKQTPAQFVQTEVQSELSKASLDVVTPGIVEAAFVHNGFTVPGTKPVELDLKKVFAADPHEICTKLLSCDAVLYGKVLRWNRSYYCVATRSRNSLRQHLQRSSPPLTPGGAEELHRAASLRLSRLAAPRSGEPFPLVLRLSISRLSSARLGIM
jgi:hypothetical protein